MASYHTKFTYHLSVFFIPALFLFSCSLHKKHEKFVAAEKELSIPKLYKSSFDSMQMAENKRYDTFPRQVDLKPFQTAVKNQDARNTCAFFSLCAMLESYYKLEYGKELNLSEEYLIGNSKAGYYGFNENCELGVPINTFKNKGIVSESRWPYQPSWFNYGFPYYGYDETTLPEKKYGSHIPTDEIQQKPPAIDYHTFTANRGLYKTIRNLAIDSLPLIAVMILTYDQYLHCDSLNGEVKKTTYSDARNVNMNTGEFTFQIPKIYKVVGPDTFYTGEMDEEKWYNHFVLLTGYDLEKKKLYFKNSWGLEFGDQGYGFITFSEFTEKPRYSIRISKERGKIPLPADTFPYAYLTNFSDVSVNTSLSKSGTLNIELRGKMNGESPGIVVVNHEIHIVPKENALENNYSKSIAVKLGQDDSVKYGDPYIRCAWHTPKESIGKNSDWTGTHPLRLSIGSEKMEKMIALQTSTEMAYVLCTTISMYSDNQGIIKLQEIWTQVNPDGTMKGKARE